MIDEIYNSDWFKVAVILTTIAAALAILRIPAGWLWRRYIQFVVASVNKRIAIQSAKELAKQFRFVKMIRENPEKLTVYLHKDLISKISNTFILLGLASFSVFHSWSGQIDSVRGIGFLAIILSVFLIFIWRTENRILFGVENFSEYETQTIGALTRLTSLICDHDIGASEGLITELLNPSKDLKEVLR